jgi:cbb3-type cytochrome oxidase maturation protein
VEPTQWTLIIAFTTIGLAFAGGFVLFALWAIRDGQFKDVEGVKFRMLEDFRPGASRRGPRPPSPGA